MRTDSGRTADGRQTDSGRTADGQRTDADGCGRTVDGQRTDADGHCIFVTMTICRSVIGQRTECGRTADGCGRTADGQRTDADGRRTDADGQRTDSISLAHGRFQVGPSLFATIPATPIIRALHNLLKYIYYGSFIRRR